MSTNGNGHGRPVIPFAPRPEIPIVGQAMSLKAWLVQLLVTCNCSAAPEPLLIIGQVGALSAPCPQCRKRYVLQAIGAHPGGGLDLQIGALVPDVDASTPAPSVS